MKNKKGGDGTRRGWDIKGEVTKIHEERVWEEGKLKKKWRERGQDGIIQTEAKGKTKI